MSGKLSNEMSGNFLRFVNLSLGRTWLPNIAVNKKVLWMLRNASSDPNEWITLNDRNGQTVEHGCEGPVSLMTGVRVIEFTWNVGTLKIHLDDGRADGWYTYSNAMDGTLWGEGPVLRKYFPSRCKGKRFEKCIRGETTEKSVMEIAATTYLLQYEMEEKKMKSQERVHVAAVNGTPQSRKKHVDW
jgi:hypothetical protein